jgi:mannose-1-phosphate guanylyltransferase
MLHAVIMAGGSGTRFWPASRRRRPKQFLTLATDRPLLRMTFERLEGLVPCERTWVVTTAATADATRQLLPELPVGNVIAEPVARNTAACTGLAARALLVSDPEATCIVLPADHLIGDAARFRAALAAGADHVTSEGGLLTFGVRPSRPETGYGYLELGTRHADVGDWTVHRLTRFVEKPDPERAQRFASSGDFLWNAGIFAWRARDLLAEIERQLPLLSDGLERLGDAWGTAAIDSELAAVYPKLPATSVDFGVMEGAESCWTIPVDFPWSDIGSWPAAAEVLEQDRLGNTVSGRAVTLDGHRNLVVGSGPVVSVVGVSDLVVVATPDAVLVVPKDQAQRVKDVVAALEERGWDDVL